ncbi:MAG: preprotein translocase subunit SecE [Pseudomonadota bacterium]
MTENVQQVESGGFLDTIKLLLSLGAIVGGLVAYYMTPELALALRVLMVLAGVIIGVLIGLTTHKGQTLWRFIQGSRIEIRKVVWPTRQETTQITILVFIFTALLGVFFWALDAGLLWATRAATGQA